MQGNEEYPLKDIAGLISEYLGSTKQILNAKVTTLPQAGIGGIMLKVDLVTENENGLKEEVAAVCKVLPQITFTREIFDLDITFKNEVAFYEKIVPTLRNFLRQNGITKELDIFAEYFGARLSLDKNSNSLDDDAALVLENLTVSGYQNISRLEGFDLHGAKIILKDLARFHGTALGLKLKDPATFEKKIRAFCADFQFKDLEVFQRILNFIKHILLENPECAPVAEIATSFISKPIPKPRPLYATLAHCDLWVNNTMQKLENGRIVKNKFVDFQIYNFRSCASDVFFFLWSSVQLNVLKKHFDYLLKYYHKHLIEIIDELKCDVSPFSYEAFLDDLKYEASYEFGHALMFVVVVKRKHVRDSASDVEYSSKGRTFYLSETVKDDLWFMTTECHKRGWVY